MIGASFVITQYHTSAMFEGKIVGSANAIAGGWGNLGGGLAQIIMPLLFAAFIAFGISSHMAWRYSMIIPRIAMFIAGLAGQLSTEIHFALFFVVYILVALLGGLLGSGIGSNRLSVYHIKIALSVLLTLTSFKLFIS